MVKLIWSGGRSPSKIYQNQSLINFDEFLKCVDTYPRWASLIRQLMIGCLEITSLGPWHVVASMTACYDSLDCLWGSLSHSFSERRARVGLACEMSRLTLHYSELEQLLAALLVFADFRSVMFWWRSSRRTLFATAQCNTTQPINQM